MTDKQVFDFNNPNSVIIAKTQHHPITAWSASRHESFKTCPMKLQFEVVDKVRSPDNEATNRGTLVHKQCEDYLNGEIDEITDPGINAERVQRYIDEIKESEDEVITEQQWGFRSDWSPCGFFDKDCWLRVILDVGVIGEDSARVIDWKTGKFSDYSKFKYATQAMIYAVVTAMRYPKLGFVETVIYPTDGNHLPLVQRYNRKQIMELLPIVAKYGFDITNSNEFPPTPSKSNCRFCEAQIQQLCDFRDSAYE